MNLLLLSPDEVLDDCTVHLTGRRARHAHEVLRAAAGDVLRVGVRGGRVGTGEVLEQSRELLRLRVQLEADPPPRAKLDVLLAIPRPKQLKRVIPALTSLGVDTVVLVNAARVEKSYFDSKVLAPDFLDELITLGLEQARDTIPPRVLIRERFRPFVEDELDRVFGATPHRWLAHPVVDRGPEALPRPGPNDRVVLAIGPEGGWVPFELELLQQRGFLPFSLGPRILRTETAVPLLAGHVDLLRRLPTSA
ncbi:MAG: 16S rRNA (uracil(1498)-N(3))-methyltransferase [Myxococcaceae bacterium]